MAKPVRTASFVFSIILVAAIAAQRPASAAEAKPKPYRLPGVNLHEPIIWGASAEGPDGAGLAFGGQDQSAEDGRAGTRILEGGKWTPIGSDLRKANKLQGYHDLCVKAAIDQAKLLAQARSAWFQGFPAERREAAARNQLLPAQSQIAKDVSSLEAGLKGETLNGGDAVRRDRSVLRLVAVARQSADVEKSLGEDLNAESMHAMWEIQRALEQAAEPLDAEPPARTLSPIVFDRKTGLYILFGGDHCDYVTSDTWAFDPNSRAWTCRQPPTAPPPRANHALTAAGDGTVKLSGGYQYANNTDYMGGQYINRADGEFTYDIAADRWSSSAPDALAEADTRQYRTGAFHPDFFLKDPVPDAQAFQQRLGNLPANTWVAIKPPQLPQVNRDWGTAVLDVDRDQILRFSGGHCAHGGSDVLHFHLATGRWELPFPVEFPLGQTYSNTEYPDGYNLNRRPWITGHSYQSYAYEPLIKQMIFTGRRTHSYFYDPDRADWSSRAPKPKGMDHGDCFYDLTLCPTPAGIACWTKDGAIFRFDASKREWLRLKVTGAKLPGSRVDNSTMTYDSKRDRLLMVRKEYGDTHPFDGIVHALDMKTLEASRIEPANAPAAASISYLCQLRYDPDHDLVLAGCTLPADESGVRRTPAFDPAAGRWISLKITGDDPSGVKGRNVSLGLMHDNKRHLFWAVDAKSQVFVLRLDPNAAGARDMR